MDTWKLYNQIKREYIDKLEDAYAKGLMTTDEYQLAKEKLNIRTLQEMNRRLVEMSDGDRLGD